MGDLTDEQWAALNPPPWTCRCGVRAETHEAHGCGMFVQETRREVREAVEA